MKNILHCSVEIIDVWCQNSFAIKEDLKIGRADEHMKDLKCILIK